MKKRDGEKTDSEATRRARRLLDDFLSEREQVAIYSDGDLDGMVASGLLLQYLDRTGRQGMELVFPSPGELRGLRVSGAILVELPPSKGLAYTGENLLLDHHGSGPRVDLYREESVVESAPLSGDIPSVSRLVCSLLGRELELPQEAQPILRAIDHIDQGIYEDPLDLQLHRAFRLRLRDPNLRPFIAGLVRENRWKGVREWAEQASAQWDRVEERIHGLIRSARPLTPERSGKGGLAVYFTYPEEDTLAAAAMREAMLKLEEEYPLVVAIRTRRGQGKERETDFAGVIPAAPSSPQGTGVMAVEASIATKTSTDLRPLFAELRRLEGFTAGGRQGIGGVQFPPATPLEEAINALAQAVRKARMEGKTDG